VAIFTLALDQARAALSEQRTVLLLKPQDATHRLLTGPQPIPPQAAE
jgi:hypothetical protein